MVPGSLIACPSLLSSVVITALLLTANRCHLVFAVPESYHLHSHKGTQFHVGIPCHHPWPAASTEFLRNAGAPFTSAYTVILVKKVSYCPPGTQRWCVLNYKSIPIALTLNFLNSAKAIQAPPLHLLYPIIPSKLIGAA